MKKFQTCSLLGITLFLLLFLTAGAGGAQERGAEADRASRSDGHTHPVEIETETLKMGDPQLNVLWVDEKNGEYIPMNAVFRDEDGTMVKLADLIDKPTLILPVYFYCPSSCSLNLVNLAMAIKRSKLQPGEDYEVIAFSFNPAEDDENARISKRNYMRLLPEDFPVEKWKFLTGDQDNIDALVQSIGYTYKDQGDGTFIHPSALVAVAKDGKIIKYVYGSFVVGDVDMAITEAASGTPALSVKRFLGYCFNYDPKKSRSFFQYAKLSVVLVFALMGVLFFVYVKRSSRNKSGSKDERR